MSAQKSQCSICSSFRELPLHLHELVKYCEILDDEKPVFKFIRGNLEEIGKAKTVSIAKWLRLASQLESVEMNTLRYEEASTYCEPVADKLSSDANHDSTLATSITRFVFISNALEEAYRLTSDIYEKEIAKALKAREKIERKRNYSTQAAWLVDELHDSLNLPENYFHKVDGLIELSKHYMDIFKVSFDTDFTAGKASRGFSAVRSLRNHIAHAVFPIIDNPEYTWELKNPEVKKLILTLLLRGSRLAAMNVQVILGYSCKEFSSDDYAYFSEDPDTGELFKKIFHAEKYINRLHIEQTFGLNESSHWAWRSEVLE